MHSKQHYGIFGVVLGACILCSLLQTAMNTALPAVMAEFRINAAFMGITAVAAVELMFAIFFVKNRKGTTGER